jgi:plasmid replication initiation protein
MYELMKQYEKLGERTLPLDDLKELLGLDKTDYSRYDSFRAGVINTCQKALAQFTDIKFTFEPVRKKGRGGKIHALKFKISRNDDYEDPLSLSDFIDVKKAICLSADRKAEKSGKVHDDDIIESEFKDDTLEFLAGACDNEFNEAEMKVLHNLLIRIFPPQSTIAPLGFENRLHDHLQHRYDEFKLRASRTEIKNRFGYFKKLLEVDILPDS